MRCAKCGKRRTAVLCGNCGFSDDKTIWYLDQLPECDLALELPLLKSDMQQAEPANNAETCSALADRYYEQEKRIWDQEPELVQPPRPANMQPLAGQYASLLVKCGGTPTANQAYILARELQYAYDYAGNRELAEEIVHWMTFAAQRGHALAQNFLLKCYCAGKFTPKDPEQEAYWRQKIHERYRASVDQI